MNAAGAMIEIDALPLAFVIVAADGTVQAANSAAIEMFAGSVAGGAVNALFPEEEDAHRLLTDAAEAGRYRVPIQGRRADGVPFTAHAIAKFTDDGTLAFTLRELTGDDLLEASAHWFDAAFDNAPVGMAIFNTDGEYVRVNEELCRMLGRSLQELIGRRDQELTHPDDRQADVDAAWRILKGEVDRHQTEKRFVRPDGQVVWAIANLTFLRDEHGRPLSWLGQFQDISDRKDAEQVLRQMADHDDLTGIPNRRRLIQELDTRVQHADRYDEQGAVLILDLDGFKHINDTLGHGAGDQVLVNVAGALRARVRTTDTLGRLGGDEFAVVLPHATPENAALVAQCLITAVHAASGGTVTASCGVATYGPGKAATPEELLAGADRAMYRAKSAGRNAVAA